MSSVTCVRATEELVVYTTNYPLAYMAERIGQELVNVKFPAPPNIDPAFWTPDVETIGHYQQADLILTNGAGYEAWLNTVSLPRKRLVDTSKTFRDRYIPLTSDVTHSHGPKGEHSHEGVAFTTWLDSELASQQAEVIAAAISRRRPGNENRIAKNLAGLREDLVGLDEKLLASGERSGGRMIIGSHPVYQYLSRRYGLNIKSVHWEPDQVPDSVQLEELQTILAQNPTNLMLWEDQPLPEIVQILEKHNLQPVVYRPCSNRPEEGDFLSVMLENLETLDSAL